MTEIGIEGISPRIFKVKTTVIGLSGRKGRRRIIFGVVTIGWKAPEGDNNLPVLHIEEAGWHTMRYCS